MVNMNQIRNECFPAVLKYGPHNMSLAQNIQLLLFRHAFATVMICLEFPRRWALGMLQPQSSKVLGTQMFCCRWSLCETCPGMRPFLTVVQRFLEA